MQLDDPNSQALLLVYICHHTTDHILSLHHHTVTYMKQNDTVHTVDWLLFHVKGVIKHGKEEYESLMPGAVRTSKGNVHRSCVSLRHTALFTR